MASSSQILANRENAQKSTGPRTEAGKAVVAANACRHGLSGAFIILSHESAEEFQKLLNGCRAEFSPKNTHESFLVEEMAQSRWTLARARRIEVHLLDQIAGAEPADHPEARIAAELNAKSPAALATVQRYVNSASRAYYRAHRTFMQSRSAAVRNKATEVQTAVRKELEKIPARTTMDDLVYPDGTFNPIIFNPPPRYPLAFAPAVHAALATKPDKHRREK